MTNEERDLIARYVARVGGAAQSGGFAAGSVPSTQPALPPIDPEADAFLAQQFQQHPEARYRITQTALVQEAALAEAQNRIQRLQWELGQARQGMQQGSQQAAQQGGQQRGFFSSLFGGGQQQPAGAFGQSGYGQGGYQNAPPPQYPPSYQPGMFQRGGSGFLGSALTTAAGVAGGMVVGNALMDAFGGHGGAAMASPLGGEAAASPWGNAGAAGGALDGAGAVPLADQGGDYGGNPDAGDPFAGAGMPQDGGQGGYDAPASWDQSGGDVGGGGFDGGGFDSGGFDGGGFDNT